MSLAPVPDIVLAIIFAYCFIITLDSAFRFKDFEALSFSPSLFYETLFYSAVPYMDVETRLMYGRWGVFGLSVSLLIYFVWRHSVLRGAIWRILKSL